mmetsp:Transcript_1375/g.2993  ORF Transcript_1375/g.2993 Transcript_1375/m.2993 type:complete len:538 (-) Transcript_1375:677-2290(-)
MRRVAEVVHGPVPVPGGDVPRVRRRGHRRGRRAHPAGPLAVHHGDAVPGDAGGVQGQGHPRYGGGEPGHGHFDAAAGVGARVQDVVDADLHTARHGQHPRVLHEIRGMRAHGPVALGEVQERLRGLGGTAAVAVPGLRLRLAVGGGELVDSAFPTQQVAGIRRLVHVDPQAHKHLVRPVHPLVGRHQLRPLQAVGVAGRPALRRVQAQPRGLQAQPLVHPQPVAVAPRPAAALVALVRAQVRADAGEHVAGGDHARGGRGAPGVVAEGVGGLAVPGVADLPQRLHRIPHSHVQLLITVAHRILEHMLIPPHVHLHNVRRQPQVKHQPGIRGPLHGREGVLVPEPVVGPRGELEAEGLVAAGGLLRGAGVRGAHGGHYVGGEGDHVTVTITVGLDLQQVQRRRLEKNEPRIHSGVHRPLRVPAQEPVTNRRRPAGDLHARRHRPVLADVDVLDRRGDARGHLAGQGAVEEPRDVHGAHEVVGVRGAILVHAAVHHVEERARCRLHHLAELDVDLGVHPHVLLPVVRHGVQHLGHHVGG